MKLSEILGIVSLQLQLGSANISGSSVGCNARLVIAQFTVFMAKGRNNGFSLSALGGDGWC